MAPDDDSFASLSEWRVRLEQTEDTLADRERRAREDDDQAGLDDVAARRLSMTAEWDALADRYDAWARQRDLTALGRDKQASGRDVTARRLADDADPGFANRWLSAGDRDDSGGDRADSFDDREHAADARHRASRDRDDAAQDLEAAAERAAEQTAVNDDQVRHLQQAVASRTVIGQAVGLLMARQRLSSDDAFAELVQLSQTRNAKLRDVAAQVVADAQPDA
ncbi:MAG: ANTAR domain-containing protein [Actinobacteria bacterium]|nr:ANTAR domain-containing protein [Actinomycetota bacterium]MCA1720444.1 ANTAR domain-containing protein [Actinomycetota bacterium]